MVYNTVEDYEKLADAILTLKAEEAGEWNNMRVGLAYFAAMFTRIQDLRPMSIEHHLPFALVDPG